MGISKWFIIIFLHQYLNLKEIKSRWCFLKRNFLPFLSKFKERGEHPNGLIFLQHHKSEKMNKCYSIIFYIFTYNIWSSEEIDRLKLALKRTCVCPEAEKYSRKIKSNKVVVGGTRSTRRKETGKVQIYLT